VPIDLLAEARQLLADLHEERQMIGVSPVISPCLVAAALGECALDWRRRRIMQPMLEALESREAPASLSFHGGPVLTSAQIVNINGTPTNDQAAQLAPQLYNAALSQYGAGIAGLEASYQAPHIAGSAITNTQVTAALNAFIGAHPPKTGQEIYVWYLSPGQYLSDALVGGWHTSTTANGATVGMAVVYAQNTFVELHEIVEAATDLRPSTGWFAANPSQEIADLGGVATWNGYEVATIVNRDGSLAALPPAGGTPSTQAQPQTPANSPLPWFQAWQAAINAFWAELAAVEQALLTWEQALVAAYSRSAQG
jgi:hypothetical protein